MALFRVPSAIRFCLAQVLATISVAVGAFAQAPVEKSVDTLLKAMPLRTKIGQMFIIGFQGQSLNEDLTETLNSVAPGGVIVFRRNISSAKQISGLIFGFQKLSMKNSRVPLLVATDQEGGDVIRIRTAIPLPSALALGHTNPETVERAGLATGRLLKTLGFNMNLAPVLDLSDSKDRTFVGTRAYGGDAKTVSTMGGSFASGLLRAGVLPTGKHFPGHGGIAEDSHLETPEKSVSRETLLSSDLAPFAALQERFKADWAVMLGHVAYPLLDPSRAPATLSKPIVTGILREKLGFEGVVLTDDIGMAGAYQIKDVRERVLRSIEAGSDMIMVAWNRRLQRELISVVETAVRKGRISEARVDQSVRRIIAAKRLYAKTRDNQPSHQELQAALKDPEFARIGEVTLRARLEKPLAGEPSSIREEVAGKPVLVFSANARFSADFAQGLSGQSVRAFNFDRERVPDVDRIMRANPQSVGVFYLSGVQAEKIASRISEDVARRIVLVTVEVEGTLKNLAYFKNVIAVYTRHPLLGRMLADSYFAPNAKETADSRIPAAKDSRPERVAPQADRAAPSEF